MKKILVFGANGMLAKDVIEIMQGYYTIIKADKEECDIRDFDQINSFIQDTMPDIIVNLAAYTNVETAEDSENKTNYEVNTLAVYYLAKICKEYSINLICISTDYVFDGEKEQWYDEIDLQNPINQYGMAKYIGEVLALRENKNAIIIRTSWLYGGWLEYKNFVNTMIELEKKKKELKIINDQIGNPTYTRHLAKAIRAVVDDIEKYKGRTLHFSNSTRGQWISRYIFAKNIFEMRGNSDIKLIACTSDEYNTKARRPKTSILKNASDIQLPEWKEWLQEYIDTIQDR